MENNSINNEPVKRGRGRPKKNAPPVVKPPPKPSGRPRKREHRYDHFKITHEEYKRLKDIEKKYLEILEK